MTHEEATCEVHASPSAVFDHIDHPDRGHMSRKSWRLAGMSMSIETDAQGGRAVGSHIRLGGRMLGIALAVECVVVKRVPSEIKEWETVGTPRLLVIGPYRMSARVVPHNGAASSRSRSITRCRPARSSVSSPARSAALMPAGA